MKRFLIGVLALAAALGMSTFDKAAAAETIPATVKLNGKDLGQVQLHEGRNMAHRLPSGASLVVMVQNGRIVRGWLEPPKPMPGSTDSGSPDPLIPKPIDRGPATPLYLVRYCFEILIKGQQPWKQCFVPMRSPKPSIDPFLGPARP